MLNDGDSVPVKKIDLHLDWMPDPVPESHSVTFLPSGQTVIAQHNESVFESASAAHIAVPTTCGGKGTCGCCLIKVIGEARPPTSIERRFIRAVDLQRGIRLACRLFVDMDLIIEILEEPISTL